MSSILHQDPPSLRKRLGRATSIVLAGSACCALALFGLDAFLVDHPVKAEAEPAVAARDLGAYVGTWVSDRGARLIVAKSGAVWADEGALIGAARLDRADRARVVVEGATFRCSYRVASERPDALVWTVVEGTPGTACPQGRYSRHFTF